MVLKEFLIALVLTYLPDIPSAKESPKLIIQPCDAHNIFSKI